MSKLNGVLRSGCTAVIAISMSGLAATPPMLGYGPASADAERQVERDFDHQLDPAEMRGWLQQMSSAPNHVGSPHDKANAEFMLARFKEWGWDAHLETFDVLYATPKSRVLELIAPQTFRASLREPPIPEDATSRQNDDALPPYNVYAADGDVTGDLVYVNYGMPEDYLELARQGIDVRGKIVLARYGGGWRGTKVKQAQDHGALACVIYSDPADDGEGQGDVYPAGGWRPPQGAERGSVLDTALYPGDPLTPGVAATPEAKRLDPATAPTLPRIPALPISAADAQPLLAALRGRVAPAAWRGGEPLTYHLGPGPARVHLAVKSDWRITPLYDVIASIPGVEQADQWVLRGNHHDGWTYGAWDPLSGNTALLAEAKAIGALLKTGWRPRRTLIYASWDAEEPGWIGSTEWVEAHLDELQRKGVVYLNSDTNARGFLSAGGTLSLQQVVNEVASEIVDPETGGNVLSRALAKRAVDRYVQNKPDDPPAESSLSLQPLGAGSDFTAFMDHAGLPALDVSYEGEDEQAGAYHSGYDTYEHFLRFGDPHFAYEVAEAQTAGHLILRIADAEILPMQFQAVAESLQRNVLELHQLVEQHNQRVKALSSLIAQQQFALAADPRAPLAAPTAESPAPPIEFGALDQAIKALDLSARSYDKAYKRSRAAGAALPASRRRALNAMLQSVEMTLTDPQGLPGREWFKHMVYAPGRYSGYRAKIFPFVREALEQGRWDEANQGIARTAAALNRYRQRLDEATAVLKRTNSP